MHLFLTLFNGSLKSYQKNNQLKRYRCFKITEISFASIILQKHPTIIKIKS